MGSSPLVIKGLPRSEYHRQYRLANPPVCSYRPKVNHKHYAGLWPRQMRADERRRYEQWQHMDGQGDVFPAGWTKPKPALRIYKKLLPEELAARKRANTERYQRARGVKPMAEHKEALFFKTWGQQAAREELRKSQVAEREHGRWWGTYASRIELWEPWRREALANPVLFLWCLDRIRRLARKAAKRRSKRTPGSREFVSSRLRKRISRSIKEGKGLKSGKSREILGCDWPTVRAHLEARFQPGMTWENYGYFGWHIDHIKPLARFDLSDPAQVKQAWHFTNLQPLWAADNYAKLDN